jgi:hypothetical protein
LTLARGVLAPWNERRRSSADYRTLDGVLGRRASLVDGALADLGVSCFAIRRMAAGSAQRDARHAGWTAPTATAAGQ